MWQELVAPYVDSGVLAVVGVVQEQHPDRARLYEQWKRLGWPIFVDSLNLLGIKVVPVPVALDASGVVRAARISPGQFVSEFLEREYAVGGVGDPRLLSDKPDVAQARKRAESTNDASDWLAVGDARFLRDGGPTDLDAAIAAYRRVVAADPADGKAEFRLGVALRRRYESGRGRPGDAQAAVDHWVSALAIDPNQYIWRRRIQQYGPRLDKPYNFYFWIEKAKREILARGEEPVRLAIPPTGSEIAAPERRSSGDASPRIPNPDPEGRIARDTKQLVTTDVVTTPGRVRPGRRVRVRVTLRLNERTTPYWNNEYKGLLLSVTPPVGFTITEGEFKYPNVSKPETREVRRLEFEVEVSKNTPPGTLDLPAYAIYDVCEDAGGVCRHLRQDFTVRIVVDPSAPKIQ